jgi:SAM-dependent methyltransferase
MDQKPDYGTYKPEEYFEKINTPAKSPLYYKQFHYPIIEETKREAGDKKVKLLDVACGPGAELDFIKDDPQVEIIGIDISEKVLKEAEERLKTASNKPIFIVADTEHSPLADNSVDVGMALNAFGYKPDKVLQMLFKALKPGKKCAMNFRIHGNPYNDAFFEYYLKQGAKIEDGNLKLEIDGEARGFPLKVVDYTGCVDIQTKSLDRQVFLTSLADVNNLIVGSGFEIVDHDTFHFSSIADSDNEMDVFTLQKPFKIDNTA